MSSIQDLDSLFLSVHDCIPCIRVVVAAVEMQMISETVLKARVVSCSWPDSQKIFIFFTFFARQTGAYIQKRFRWV